MTCLLEVDVRESRSGVPGELVKLGLTIDMKQRPYDYHWDGCVIERKTWTDMLASMGQHSVVNGVRVNKVVRQLQAAQQAGRAWLVVEGEFWIAPDTKGQMVVCGTGWKWAAVEAFVLRLRTRGVQIEYTTGPKDTASFIAKLYKRMHEASKAWPLPQVSGLTAPASPLRPHRR